VGARCQAGDQHLFPTRPSTQRSRSVGLAAWTLIVLRMLAVDAPASRGGSRWRSRCRPCCRSGVLTRQCPSQAADMLPLASLIVWRLGIDHYLQRPQQPELHRSSSAGYSHPLLPDRSAWESGGLGLSTSGSCGVERRGCAPAGNPRVLTSLRHRSRHWSIPKWASRRRQRSFSAEAVSANPDQTSLVLGSIPDDQPIQQ
jgi:hypothetical protein